MLRGNLRTYLIRIHIFDLNQPFTFGLFPESADYLVFKFHVPSGPILVGNILDILLDFFASGIVIGPFWVILEEELKARRWNIARDAGIFVLKPDSTNI